MSNYLYGNTWSTVYKSVLSVGASADHAGLSASLKDVWTDDGAGSKNASAFQLSTVALKMVSTNKLLFQDTGTYIYSNADGDLDLVADGSGQADAINIESASGITLDAGDATYGVTYEDDGTAVLRITHSSNDVILKPVQSNKDIIFQEDGGTEIARLDSSAESFLMATNKKIEFSTTDEHIYSDGTDIHFGVGSGGDINIPQDIGLTFGNDGEKIEGNGTKMTIGGGGVDITATAASTWHTSAGDLTIGGTSQANAINIKSVEDTADSITMVATTGGIDITADGAAAKDLDLTCTNGSVNITAGESANDSIVIQSTQGGIDITAYNAAAGEDIDITANGSSINITATENVANAIYLHSSGGTSETIKVHNDQGTGDDSIYVLSDVGGISIESGKTSAITNMTSNEASSITNAVIRIGTDTANCDIAIGNATSDVLIGENLKVAGTLHVTGAQSYSSLTVSHASKSVVTLTNTEQSDSDGARDCWLVFTGETSSGTGHQLAYIKAIHDSTDSDKDGALEFYTNDGADTDDALTKRLELDNAGNVRCQGAVGLPATSKLYLDGEDCSGNTYISETAADDLAFNAGGTKAMVLDANSYVSLSNNDNGSQNTVFGYDAGASIGSGDNYNTFIGYQVADADMTNATYNTGIGWKSLSALTTGDHNTGVGPYTLYTLNTGSSNTALGHGSMTYVQDGSYNTSVGTLAGSLIVSGSHNTCTGYQAGDTITSGTHNVYIGYNADASANSVTNEIVINAGNGALVGGGTETTRIGQSTDYIVNDFGENATWTHSSDVRIKKNIENSDLGLSFINALRPVRFKKKAPSEYPVEFESYDENKTTRNKPDFINYGFIAQEVKEAMDSAGHSEFPVWSENRDGMQSLGETELITPLVKAIQELSAKVVALENQ